MAVSVPNSEGKHAIEARNIPSPSRKIERKQHLRVRMAAKAVAISFEFHPQGAEIEDFAVEHDNDPPIGAPHRLMAQRRQIENGKPAVDKTNA